MRSLPSSCSRGSWPPRPVLAADSPAPPAATQTHATRIARESIGRSGAGAARFEFLVSRRHDRVSSFAGPWEAFLVSYMPLALDMEATTFLALPSCRTPSKRRAWRPGGWRARGAAGRHGPVRIGGRGSLLSRRNGALPYSTGDFKWVVNCLLVCFTDAKTWSRSADTRTGRGARSRAPSLYPAPEHHSRFRWRIGERS